MAEISLLYAILNKIMLIETVENIYSSFSKYRANRPLDICTNCCMTLENENLLASLPLKNISKELLAEYNDGACTGLTPINELKHFLPRYLDLIAQFEFPTHSSPIALKRLDPFDKNEWTTVELNLLEKFSQEFFKKCLTLYPLPNYEFIDDIIIMFWKGQFNLNKLFQIWEQDSSKESVMHYRDIVLSGFINIEKLKLANSFGDKLIAEKLVNWINKPNVNLHFSKAIETILLTNQIEDEDILRNFYNLLEITTKKNGI